MYLWRVEKYLWTDSPPNLVDILHVFLFCTNFSTESKCTVRLPCLLKRQQGQNVGEKIKPKTLKCGQNRQKTKKAVGKPRGLYIWPLKSSRFESPSIVGLFKVPVGYRGR